MEENKKKDLEANELNDDVLEGAAGGIVMDGVIQYPSFKAFEEKLRKEGKLKLQIGSIGSKVINKD